MFSCRLHWDTRPNPLSQVLSSRRASGAEILDLTESNPTQAGVDYPDQEILAALTNKRALRYEPSAAGLESAREAIARDYYGARGVAVDPARILLAASTSEAYGYLLKLLADPGAELLVPRPSYPLFDFLAALESVQIVSYPLVYHEGWSIDMDELARSVTTRTRGVAVVNPNNPTGSFLKKEEFARLTALCRECDIAIISDEVFADYPLTPDAKRVEHVYDSHGALSFTLSGLSKVAGLPQMKLGWIVVGGPHAGAMERLELIADTYLSVAAPVQHATADLLRVGAAVREQIRQRIRRNLAALREQMSSSVNRILDVEGGWYATMQAPLVRSSEEWALELLERRNVLVQPGYFYDFHQEALLVLSLLTREEVFAEGIARISEHVNEAIR